MIILWIKVFSLFVCLLFVSILHGFSTNLHLLSCNVIIFRYLKVMGGLCGKKKFGACEIDEYDALL